MGPDASLIGELGALAAALAAAVGLLARAPRPRAAGMLVAALLAPALLIADIWDRPALTSLRDRPMLAVAGAIALVAVVVVAAWLFHRRPALLALAAVAALPFRLPISTGEATANLLLPLYMVVAAGVLAAAIPALAGRGGLLGGGEGADASPASDPPTGWGQRLRERLRGGDALALTLAAFVVLYAVTASYSLDFTKAVQQLTFFFVPFALLFVLLTRLRWTRRLAVGCLGVALGLALVFAGIGFVEYATRTLLLNPRVISSNQLEETFRVNSLFFDPNIYGRFLATVMILTTAVVLWTSRRRDLLLAAVALVVLLAGLVLTFSQSSIAALLVGLAVLAALRWSVRWTLAVVGGLLLVGVLVLALAPGALKIKNDGSSELDKVTSGRSALITGGADLFEQRPLQGWGAASFSRAYRREQRVSRAQATTASHTIPLTIAAEQGIVGLAVYIALLVAAFARLFRGARTSARRSAVAAAFAALVLHTMLYAAFLEDPLTWTLLGIGSALAAGAGSAAAARRDGERAREQPATTTAVQ